MGLGQHKNFELAAVWTPKDCGLRLRPLGFGGYGPAVRLRAYRAELQLRSSGSSSLASGFGHPDMRVRLLRLGGADAAGGPNFFSKGGGGQENFRRKWRVAGGEWRVAAALRGGSASGSGPVWPPKLRGAAGATPRCGAGCGGLRGISPRATRQRVRRGSRVRGRPRRTKSLRAELAAAEREAGGGAGAGRHAGSGAGGRVGAAEIPAIGQNPCGPGACGGEGWGAESLHADKFPAGQAIPCGPGNSARAWRGPAAERLRPRLPPGRGCRHRLRGGRKRLSGPTEAGQTGGREGEPPL